MQPRRPTDCLHSAESRLMFDSLPETHAEVVAMSPQLVRAVSLEDKNVENNPAEDAPLGHVDWDGSAASNERAMMRSSIVDRDRIMRDQYVRIEDAVGSRTGFLGRIVAGPFFSTRGVTARGSNVPLGMGLSGEVGIV